MNVFQINTVCGSGSTGRIAVNLAKMLEEKDIIISDKYKELTYKILKYYNNPNKYNNIIVNNEM